MQGGFSDSKFNYRQTIFSKGVWYRMYDDDEKTISVEIVRR